MIVFFYFFLVPYLFFPGLGHVLSKELFLKGNQLTLKVFFCQVFVTQALTFSKISHPLALFCRSVELSLIVQSLFKFKNVLSSFFLFDFATSWPLNIPDLVVVVGLIVQLISSFKSPLSLLLPKRSELFLLLFQFHFFS